MGLPDQVEQLAEPGVAFRKVGDPGTELVGAPAREVLDRRRDQLGLRREVMDLRPARDPGVLGDARGRGVDVAELDEAVDRRVEQGRLVVARRSACVRRAVGADLLAAGATQADTVAPEAARQQLTYGSVGLL